MFKQIFYIYLGLVAVLGYSAVVSANCGKQLSVAQADAELKALSDSVKALDLSTSIDSEVVLRVDELLNIANLSFPSREDYIRHVFNDMPPGFFMPPQEILTAEVEISGVKIRLFKFMIEEYSGELEFTQAVYGLNHGFFGAVMGEIFGLERMEQIIQAGKFKKGIFTLEYDSESTVVKLYPETFNSISNPFPMFARSSEEYVSVTLPYVERERAQGQDEDL